MWYSIWAQCPLYHCKNQQALAIPQGGGLLFILAKDAIFIQIVLEKQKWVVN